MEIPASLDNWDFETLRRLTDEGTAEDGRFDFKGAEVLYSKDRSETLSKAASAFLNASGGFIIIGVAQRDEKWRIEGVKADLEVAKLVNDAIRVFPRPNYPSPKKIQIPLSPLVCYVVHVPAGDAGPYASVLGEHPRFYRRTASGSTPMDWYGIRDAMMKSEERRTRASMLLHEIEQALLVIRGHQYNDLHREPLNLERIELTTFRRLYEDVFPIIATNPHLTQALAGLLRLMNQLNAVIDVLALQTSRGGRQGMSDDWLAKRNTLCSSIFNQAGLASVQLADQMALPKPNFPRS